MSPKFEDSLVAELARNPRLRGALTPQWSQYIPHRPTPKQLGFLMVPHDDAFYGGALGGGKSDALLMAALQYVHVPNYSAIIFRKSFSDLSLSGNLIDRSQQWLFNTDAKWNSQLHRWKFPSGAKIAFGFLGADRDKYRYYGAEFQFIGFDECTQLREGDVKMLTTRLRKIKGINVPLRIRMASNPGNVGHLWVKQRYMIDKDPVTGLYRGFNPNAPYIPAYITDNPYLDSSPYIRKLKQELDPVTLAQLLAGDWGISADGRFRLGWKRTYRVVGANHYNPLEPWICKDSYILLGPDFQRLFHLRDCRMFQTVDPAASQAAGPNGATSRRGEPNWTVIATWFITPHNDLILWHVERFRAEIPDVIRRIFDSHNRFKPTQIGIENNGTNLGVYQICTRAGLPIFPLEPGTQDKLARAADATNRMERGRVFFPESPSEWLKTFEEEIFTWSGLPNETDDQVDAFAYAALYTAVVATQNPFHEQSVVTGSMGPGHYPAVEPNNMHGIGG